MHMHKTTLQAPLYNQATVEYHMTLKDLAHEVNKKQSTWKAGANKRWDYMGKAAIIGQMGAKKNPNAKPLPKVDDVMPGLPADFDARVQWPKCESISEIRDQANCGSCWAFGAVEAISDRICIASGQKRQDKISAQDMVTCCDSCGMGCEGGYLEAAWEWYQQTGVVTGDLFGDTNWCQAYSLQPCDHHTTGKYGPCPAVVPTPSCESQCVSQYTTGYSDDKHFATSAYGVSSDPTAIQTEIYKNGPVEAAFDVYEDFLSYKTGVYQHTTGSLLGGHAIKVMGWGVEDGTPYWLIANSWNTDWGDNGTFKILRGQDECGIESGVVAGMPAL